MSMELLHDMNGMNLALTILLTGLVVVFVVLIILTLVIKLYGSSIYNLQNKTKGKNTSKSEISTQVKNPEVITMKSQSNSIISDEEISGEILAIISAAVFTIYTLVPEKTYQIKNIKRSSGVRPVWGIAGVIENTQRF